jgi:hypothetical protein
MRNEVVDKWDIGEVLSGGEAVAGGQRENLAAPVFSESRRSLPYNCP